MNALQMAALLLAAVLTTVLLFPLGAAAGKPGSSKPTTVEGVAPYSATPLFDSTTALAAARTAISTDLTHAQLLRELEVDTDGAVFSLFYAADEEDQVELYYEPPGSPGYIPGTEHMGIVRWDGSDLVAIYDSSITYGGVDGDAYDVDLYTGEAPVAFDLVPTQDAANGVLAAGDLVVLRWVADDESTEVLDDMVFEVVRFSPSYGAGGAFLGLTEEETLFTLPVDRPIWGLVIAGPSGEVYVSVPDNAGTGYDVLELAYDAVTDEYTSTDVEPSGIEIHHWIDVDESGYLYAVGQTGTSASGTIYRRSPATGTWSAYASYSQRFEYCLGHDYGEFLIALRETASGKHYGEYYVATVTQGAAVSRDDRVADVYPKAVQALGADSGGSLYALHQDYSYVDGAYVAVDQVVYQLDADSSSGGGSGGGGRGGGKGKNK